MAKVAKRGARQRGLYRIMVCPDAHHPFVDGLAWSTFIAAARTMRPDALVIIGDFWDCYAASAHSKDPRRKNRIKAELEITNRAADQISRLDLERVEFVQGNHETRIERMVADRVPELDGMLSSREMLRVDDRGWGWTPYKTSIRIGAVNFTHDVERCGVHTARQSVLDYGGNIVVGHSHRLGVAYAGNTRGDTHVGLNVGWLGDYSAIDYRHRDMAQREWQHGLGWITQAPDGVSWCQAVPIIDGRCIIDGNLISGRRRSS